MYSSQGNSELKIKHILLLKTFAIRFIPGGSFLHAIMNVTFSGDILTSWHSVAFKYPVH